MYLIPFNGKVYIECFSTRPGPSNQREQSDPIAVPYSCLLFSLLSAPNNSHLRRREKSKCSVNSVVQSVIKSGVLFTAENEEFWNSFVWFVWTKVTAAPARGFGLHLKRKWKMQPLSVMSKPPKMLKKESCFVSCCSRRGKYSLANEVLLKQEGRALNRHRGCI